MLQDPVYRDAVAAAEEAGTPDAAQTIYAIKLAALAEQNRIRGDTNLSGGSEEHRAEADRTGTAPGEHGGHRAGLAAGAAACAARDPAEKGLCPRPGQEQRRDDCAHVRFAGRTPSRRPTRRWTSTG